MAETRNHIFSKEISQVMIAAMVLAQNFYWKNFSASDFSYERKSALSRYFQAFSYGV